MSGISFTFDLAPSSAATQAAPASKATDAAALEQSFLFASTPRASAPVQAGGQAGPGVSTLALGEEDGGSMSAMPQPGAMSAPAPSSEYQVTTLAIGEEDGGMSSHASAHSSTAMAPIGDDHSEIGGSGGWADRVAADTGLDDGYGMMQPIYSPGEAEYPAFAKTSETTDLLNFHPVERVSSYTATVTQSVAAQPMAAPAPAPSTFVPTASVDTTYATVLPGPAVTDTQVVMSPTPVEPAASGEYQSVGRYEDYVSGMSGTVTPAPPSAPVETYAAPQPVYETFEPVAEAGAYEPVASIETTGSRTTAEPVYEAFAPAVEASGYEAAQATEAPFPDVVSQPVYETYGPATVETGAYEFTSTEAMPAEAAFEPIPFEATAPQAAPEPVYETFTPAAEASGYEATRTVDAAPVETAPAADGADAPLVSAEPSNKPPLFEKDSGFSFAEQAPDPADGKPDLAAPVATAPVESAPAQTAPMEPASAVEPKAPAPVEVNAAVSTVTAPTEPAAAETAAASMEAEPTSDSKPEASYVEVSIDDYIVDTPPAADAPATEDSSTTEDTASEAEDTLPSPPIAPTSAPAAPAQSEGVSLGGSFTILDEAMPGSISGDTSGMMAPGGMAAPDGPSDSAPARGREEDSDR